MKSAAHPLHLLVFCVILLIAESVFQGCNSKVMNLHPRVMTTTEGIQITNGDGHAWRNVQIFINDLYCRRIQELPAGQEARIGYQQFLNAKGESFNPYASAIDKLEITTCDEKDRVNGRAVIRSKL